MSEEATFSGKRIVRFVEKCFLIVLICVVFSGCTGDASADNRRENAPAETKMKEIKHPNGLRLNAPENLTVNQTAAGFAVAPPSSRGMSEVEISVEETGGAAADESFSKRKTIGGRTIVYKIERRSSGGSGGDEYTAAALETIGNRTIRYEQSDTAETGEPSFEFFWSLVEATTL